MKKNIALGRIGVLVATLILSPAYALGDNLSKELAKRIDKVIEKANARPLRSDANTPWVVMHAVVAFEKDLEVYDVDAGKKVNAIDYLTRHAKFESKLIYQDVDGVPTLKTRGRGTSPFWCRITSTNTCLPTPTPASAWIGKSYPGQDENSPFATN